MQLIKINNLLIFIVISTLFASEAFSICEVPESISTKVLFSEKCNFAVFSSNRNGNFQPFKVNFENKIVTPLLNVEMNRDYFVKDISKNCKDIAMVSDIESNGQYEVFHYNLTNQILKKISRPEITDSGNPIFSENGNYLAHTSGPTMIIWDVEKAVEVTSFKAPGNILTYSFSESGNEIFLQESDGKLSKLNLVTNSYLEIWKPAKQTFPPYSIKTFQNNLFFTSDHETGYSQIYKLDLGNNKISSINPQPNDQYDPMPSNSNVFFRYSKKGSYCLNSLVRNNLLANVPCDGVVYGILPHKVNTPFVYSNYGLPTSIFLLKQNKKLENLLNIQSSLESKKPEPIENVPGLPHYYFPATKLTKSLVVWIHGGPHTEISPRYNHFIANLQANGHSVLALNYPGSTGAGNNFEMRGSDEDNKFDYQTLAIEKSIQKFLGEKPQFSELNVISVSYGSNLLHKMFSNNKINFKKGIDFSGKNDLPPEEVKSLTPPSQSKLLFIFGENDPFSHSPERSEIINRYKEKGNSKVIKLEKDGHSIQTLQNNQLVCDSIVSFLSDNDS